MDPQRWQCCMTPELLALARSNREDEALENLMDGLLGKFSNGMCSNIGECVSGGCATRNSRSPETTEATEAANKQGRMAQTAGD